MPTPLHFSDEEMDLLLASARPIEPAQRSAFLDAVAEAIGGQASGPAPGNFAEHDRARALRPRRLRA